MYALYTEPKFTWGSPGAHFDIQNTRTIEGGGQVFQQYARPCECPAFADGGHFFAEKLHTPRIGSNGGFTVVNAPSLSLKTYW